MFVIHVLYLLISVKIIKKKKKLTSKTWLIDNVMLQLGGLTHFLNIGVYFNILFDSKEQWSSTVSLVFSIFFVLYALALYVSIQIVAPKLKTQLYKEYPDYRLT